MRSIVTILVRKSTGKIKKVSDDFRMGIGIVLI